MAWKFEPMYNNDTDSADALDCAMRYAQALYLGANFSAVRAIFRARMDRSEAQYEQEVIAGIQTLSALKRASFTSYQAVRRNHGTGS